MGEGRCGPGVGILVVGIDILPADGAWRVYLEVGVCFEVFEETVDSFGIVPSERHGFIINASELGHNLVQSSGLRLGFS